MEDLCDGDGFWQHSLFSASTNSLQILFYYDDVEVCNPLQSSRLKHKLGMYVVCLYTGNYSFCVNVYRIVLLHFGERTPSVSFKNEDD